MSLWAQRYFDDEYWLRKSCNQNEAEEFFGTNCGERSSTERRADSVAGLSESITTLRLREPAIPALVRRIREGTGTLRNYLAGIDPEPDDEWKLGTASSMQELVYDFEGTDLALVFSLAADAIRKVRLARVVSRRTNLHMIELYGATAGPPGLIWQQIDFTNAPMSVQLMLNWAMLEELIRTSEADNLENVSCCEAHVRPTIGRNLIHTFMSTNP